MSEREKFEAWWAEVADSTTDVYWAWKAWQARAALEQPAEKLFSAERAEADILARCEELWGEENILGIGWDWYDCSLEIYVTEGAKTLLVTNECVAAIKALGFVRFWINYPDGSDQYMEGKRTEARSEHNRWQAWNTNSAFKRAATPALSAEITPEDQEEVQELASILLSIARDGTRHGPTSVTLQRAAALLRKAYIHD